MILKGLNEGKNTLSHSEGEAVVFVGFLCFLRFFIRFCASHRKFLLSPTWGGTWFTIAFYNQRGDSTLDYRPLVALALLNIS